MDVIVPSGHTDPVLPYDEEGGAGPVIVLLHAGIADRTMWTEHLSPLAHEGYRVLALDLPGFGEAAIGAGEQAPWRDVGDSLGALGVERAALVGNSFGGAVALRVAVTSPDLVAALVLVSAPPVQLDPSDELTAAWAAEEDALERGDVDAAVRAVVDAWTLPGASDALRARVGTMQRRAFELGLAGDESPEAPDPLEDNPDLLAAIDVPALVAVGERDMVDFRRGAEVLADALPRARHEVIAGAGHLAPLETPGAFRALLLAFLSEVDAA